jgi:hypothetical protein
MTGTFRPVWIPIPFTMVFRYDIFFKAGIAKERQRTERDIKREKRVK